MSLGSSMNEGQSLNICILSRFGCGGFFVWLGFFDKYASSKLYPTLLPCGSRPDGAFPLQQERDGGGWKSLAQSPGWVRVSSRVSAGREEEHCCRAKLTSKKSLARSQAPSETGHWCLG